MKKKYIASAGIGFITLATHVSAASVEREMYVYDGAGNIVEKQIGDDVMRFNYKGDTLTSDSRGPSYSYDAAGRLIEESRDGQVQRKLSYEYGDKVTCVEAREVATEFFYNAEGQLVGKKSADQSEAFAWDGLALIMRGDKIFSNEEHPVGGVPTLIGSEVAVCDGAGSTLSVGTKRFSASSFGESLKEGLFTGKPYVEELESFVFNHRNYSVDNCRWTTTDPSGFPDGPNNYLYACNDPISNVDPTGLMTLGSAAPSPASKNQPAPGNVKVTAYNASMRDNRSISRDLILNKINPNLPAGSRYTVSLGTVDPGGTISIQPYKAAYGYGTTLDSNTSAGGCVITVSYSGVTQLPGYSEESIQTVFSNVAGPSSNATANASYLDNNGGTVPFYQGIYNASASLTDNPSRGWNMGTHWTADVNYVTYNSTQRLINMPPDSSFKYSWDMKEQ